MTEIDGVILEYLYTVGREHEFKIAQPPKIVWYNLAESLEMIDKSPATVRRRMKALADHDLLIRVDEKRGYYQIAEKGIRYVDGDLSRSDLEPTEMDDDD